MLYEVITPGFRVGGALEIFLKGEPRLGGVAAQGEDFREGFKHGELRNNFV